MSSFLLSSGEVYRVGFSKLAHLSEATKETKKYPGNCYGFRGCLFCYSV